MFVHKNKTEEIFPYDVVISKHSGYIQRTYNCDVYGRPTQRTLGSVMDFGQYQMAKYGEYNVRP